MRKLDDNEQEWKGNIKSSRHGLHWEMLRAQTHDRDERSSLVVARGLGVGVVETEAEATDPEDRQLKFLKGPNSRVGAM